MSQKAPQIIASSDQEIKLKKQSIDELTQSKLITTQVTDEGFSSRNGRTIAERRGLKETQEPI
jgi:hypothetical protein